MHVEDFQAYLAEVTQAIDAAPASWAIVVDTSDAPPQSEEVSQSLNYLQKYVIERGAAFVAVVTSKTVTALQQRRLLTGPGMHETGTVGFYDDFASARAAAEEVLAGAR